LQPVLAGCVENLLATYDGEQRAGDLNQDGWLDAAVEDGTSNSIGVLLGGGDGTFQPVVSYSTGMDLKDRLRSLHRF
jgi:hypothetical protein